MKALEVPQFSTPAKRCLRLPGTTDVRPHLTTLVVVHMKLGCCLGQTCYLQSYMRALTT